MSHTPELSTDPAGAVFRTLGLTKVYRMGDVRVEALRGVDMTLYGVEARFLLWEGKDVLQIPASAGG